MPCSPLAGQALTVLGPVAAAALGVTLPHEHLLLDLRFIRTPPAREAARSRRSGWPTATR